MDIIDPLTNLRYVYSLNSKPLNLCIGFQTITHRYHLRYDDLKYKRTNNIIHAITCNMYYKRRVLLRQRF